VLVCPTISGRLSTFINLFILPITLMERFGLGGWIVPMFENWLVGITDRLMRPASFAEVTGITADDYTQLRADARRPGQGRVRAECYWAMRANDLRGKLKQITAPALIIWGMEDNTVPLRDASVVAIDLGMKRDILDHLTGRGFEVQVVPSSTAAEHILDLRPGGVFVSNGPGDPEPLTTATETLRGLLGKVPVFGICLGHQVLGLAVGARTYKLPFGHHGGNHPVRRLQDGRVEITAQNHGFAVDLWSLTDALAAQRTGLVTADLLPPRVESAFGDLLPTHQNLNDGTLEGMRLLDVPAFSVQYHPEAAPGPRDAAGHFDEFVGMIEGGL